MPNKERCIIRKGVFLETVLEINDKFVFVSLDVDLYDPTLAGLEFFIPNMVKGGIILVHYYFQMSILVLNMLLLKLKNNMILKQSL